MPSTTITIYARFITPDRTHYAAFQLKEHPDLTDQDIQNFIQTMGQTYAHTYHTTILQTDRISETLYHAHCPKTPISVYET